MTLPDMTTCPACGSRASGKFCSACGASLGSVACAGCQAQLSPRARFCHRCGRPVGTGSAQSSSSDRKVWLIAGTLCILTVAAIAYGVSSGASQPAVPDMANVGAATGSPDRPAPDISRMTPGERFERLFNRITQAAERGDSGEARQFTPMALGAYSQLDTVDADSRYHAAMLRILVADFGGARALADTILTESPGHLFGYLIRGELATHQNDPTLQTQAGRDFLAHYNAAMRSKRVEYLEHKPVLDEFKTEAEKAERTEKAER